MNHVWRLLKRYQSYFGNTLSGEGGRTNIIIISIIKEYFFEKNKRAMALSTGKHKGHYCLQTASEV